MEAADRVTRIELSDVHFHSPLDGGLKPRDGCLWYMGSNVPKDAYSRLADFVKSHGGFPLEIVSYDVSGGNSSTGSAVSFFIFGRVVRALCRDGPKEYRYPGLIEKGGVASLGQSVVILTPERAEELRAFLDRKGVTHWTLRIRGAVEVLLNRPGAA